MKFLDGVEPINFDEKEHKYTDKTGRELISVTTLIHLYQPIFDPTGEILINKAIKEGVTPEELRKQWDYERDAACERGTQAHKELEYWIDNGKIDKKGEYKDVVKQIKNIKFKGDLKSETILWSKKYGIAGTCDLFDFYDSNQVDIWDLKTNKSIKKTSFFRRGQGFEMMLPPIQHLQNANFIVYSLQLSIYELLVEELGFWVNNKTLIYVTPKTKEVKLIPVLPLRKEALAIIEHYHKNKNIIT